MPAIQPASTVRVLAVSDQVDPRIYSSSVRERMEGVQVVIGCGDLPGRYLEFLADAIDCAVYFVEGNHQEEGTREGIRGTSRDPMGCVNLGGRVVRDNWTGMILAGIPGSPRYNNHGSGQYTEFEISWMIARMTPRLLWNRLRYGRALDVLVTHSPPRGYNDRQDPTHRGFRAMVGFVQRFRPGYLLHGHIHLYDRNEPWEVRLAGTRVINVYPYRVLDLQLGPETVQETSFPQPASPGDAR